MKSGKRSIGVIAAGVLLATAIGAELQTWVQHVPAGPLIPVFFRPVEMPAGPVEVRRPPRETIPALTAQIETAPGNAELYKLRAREEELALEFAAAEADWRKYASLAPDRGAGYLQLADYFHRRLAPRSEVAALMLAGQSDTSAYERILSLADEQNLPATIQDAAYRAWIRRAPRDQGPRKKYIDYLIGRGEYTAAQAQIADYAKAFPDDALYPLEARANVARERDSVDAAIRIYDRAFQPLWPPELAGAYFGLLNDEGRLREFTARARTALQANPGDLDAATRLFHYFIFENNQPAARRVLVELRLAREAHHERWTATDLLTLARLFERIEDSNEAARFYYALYSLPGVSPADSEKALAGLANLLFVHAGALRFGAGDLSLYKDIATIDPSPGFLNGILSLVLNSTWPRESYAREDQASIAYFQRARAADMVDLFDRRFPKSAERASLHASLIQAYATYGDDANILRSGRAFVTSFPGAKQRVSVGLLMADAYARQNDERDEFAIYDQLLRELGAQARGLPLKTAAAPQTATRPAFASRHFAVALPPQISGIPNAFLTPQLAPDNSPPQNDYATVLDRYLSRLAALKRPLDALRVYRREIDRNPNDPALYERLAAFLEQNGMGQEIESVYRKAIAKFSDRSWYDRLARWYLRQRETAEFASLTREVTGIFSGTELETYFNQVVATAALDPVLYRQLNLYAHQRFPEDLVFVHNLLSAYAHPATYDPSASQALLRQYWFYDPNLRNRLFEQLASSGKLYAEVAAIRRDNPEIGHGNDARTTGANPAAAQFSAEAEAWMSHFESAAPEMRALAEAYPGDRSLTSRASSVYRSLAAFDPADTAVAVSLAELEYKSKPRDRETLAKIGDIYADREEFDRARPVWNRMPQIEPGKPDGYLEAATVFWDYYLYSDALRIIHQARVAFDDPALFAFEAGVIYENKRDFPSAVQQYVTGGVAGNQEAEQRLLRLASRPAVEALVDRLTSRAPTEAGVNLRAAVLDAQGRTQELQAFLLGRVDLARSPAVLADLRSLGAKYGLPTVEEHAMERRIGATNDPVEKMLLRIELAKLYEQNNALAQAANVVDALYRDNPLILGAVRAAVDFHVRNKQPDAAIATLLEAAGHARPELANQFTIEAANLATGAGEYDRARTLLATLLAHDPYNAEYLAGMAATWSKAGDDSGLRDYELAAISTLKTSPLPAHDKIERIAALRRTLIPALARLNDASGAVDQYIEIINSYPDDDSLARDALLFAAAHNRTAQLLDFYRKTIAEAPRDYRWPIVLARLETYAEDYPAAIAAYDRAMKERPDRADIVQARAQLEERLMRFSDAVRTYTRLYELTYHDPQWMIKIAELHARQQQTADAMAALKSAIIGAHSESAPADFEIAGKLEAWGLIPQAAEFADRGARLAGTDLGEDYQEAHTWARVMTRARRIDPVLDFIWQNERGRGVVPAVGEVINACYTPEEKAALERKLASRKPLIEFASAAGMVDLEARWRYETMLQQGAPLDPGFIELERRRAEYEQLAQRLETYAAQRHFAGALYQAVEAYADAGDVNNELRLIRSLADIDSVALDRYLPLLSARDPNELISLIRGNAPDGVKNRAVEAAIGSGSESLAMRAVEARAAVRPPVWGKVYAALTGLYYADSAPTINAHFASALDTRTIGQRVAAPLDRDQQLAGDMWFYYGARYGEYLDLLKRPNAADYLPATVEQAPGNPDAWLKLGDYYAGKNDVAAATTDYNNVLQLDPNRGDAEDHMARLLWSRGRRVEALAHWRAALAMFLREQSRPSRLPEFYWPRAVETIRDIGRARALSELQPAIADLLRDYTNRNGSFRAEDLFLAAWYASIDGGQDPSWVVRLASESRGAEELLSWLYHLPQLTLAQRIEIKRAQIAAVKEQDDYREQLSLISLLLEAGDVRAANAEWATIPEKNRAGQQAWETQIRLAAATHTLPALFESWRDRTDIAVEAFRQAAMTLREQGHKEDALNVLDYLYRRELRFGRLDSANFLGLAEVLLERGDTGGAVSQLRRMALITPDSFDTLMPAAELLARYGHTTEAMEFVRRRIEAVPWDAEAKLRLVQMGPVANRDAALRLIVMDAQARYATRAEAARLLAPQSPPALAGTELGLLAGGRILPDSARQRYYVYARMAAAEDMSDAATRFTLMREALSIKPSDAEIRVAAVNAALASGRDSTAVAMARAAPNMRLDAALAQKLGEAARSAGDLPAARQYLDTAIRLTQANGRGALEARLKMIEAEQSRIAANRARQPMVKNVVDQERVVKPRLTGSVQ